MAWKKSPPELVSFLDSAMSAVPCQRRKMFGYPAYFVNDNMFAGLFEESLYLRLSEQDRGEILTAWDEAALLEPMEGRPMREYVVVPESLYGHPALFGEWIDRSFRYASSLQPKPAKKKG